MKQYTCIAKNTGYAILQHGIPEFICKVCAVSSWVYRLCPEGALLLLMLSSYNLWLIRLDWQINTVDLIDCSSYNAFGLIKASC